MKLLLEEVVPIFGVPEALPNRLGHDSLLATSHAGQCVSVGILTQVRNTPKTTEHDSLPSTTHAMVWSN